MMRKDLLTWPEKIREGMQLAQDFLSHNGLRVSKAFKKIAFVGMGGSGVSGRLIKTLLDKKSHIPSFIIDGPEIPAFVDAETLVLVVSYSGNTWETIDVYNELLRKHIPTIAFANGGTLLELAETKNQPFIMMPTALSPRSSIGYSLGALLVLLDKMGLLSGVEIAKRWIHHAEVYLPKYSQEQYFQDFLTLADQEEFFHLWGVAGDSAAYLYRAQTQFNENSKVHAVFSAIPELCHNLLVGLSNCKKKPLVVMASTAFLPPHLEVAVEATSEILIQRGVRLYKVPVLGDTLEDQLFDIVLWSDFASCYLGLLSGVDVVSVEIIEKLKQSHRQKGIR